MQTVFVSVFLLVSFYETLGRGENANFRPKHLFVRRTEPPRGSSRPHHTIYLPKDGNGSSKHSLKESSSTRTKRSSREARSTSTDPEHTLHEFNDQHHMLVVQWSGFNFSDTVVVLSRDISPTSESTSYLYVSNNYGVSYTNQSHKLQYKTADGSTKPALIEIYYTSPINAKWYIFADTTNNVIFTSKDDCKTLKPVSLSFTPSDIRFHASKSHGLIAYDEKTQTLYYSKDFGSTWGEREKKVISYYWGFKNLDSDDVVYLEIDNGDNTSDIIRGHYGHKHLSTFRLLRSVSDFEINDVYMFATKKSKNGLDLYVGYHYHIKSPAEFPNDLRREEYFIADASENQVFVAVNHNKNTSHLYISDVTGMKYTLSMERVLYFSPKQHKDHWLRRYADETFIDLYPVASMRGVYVASQLSYGKVGTRAVHTQISENKGRSWENVNTPRKYANGSLVNCSDSCSLHLAQQFARIHPWYFGPSIMSKPSAPGLILSSGNIGKRLRFGSNVYVSNDAGESWLEALEGRWYYNFGDHGGVLVAVRQWTPTTELKYSTDEGLTWKTYTFSEKSIRVYGLLTEPGERTTIFTLFGSYGKYHSWLVVQVNVSNVLGRPCAKKDYETWTPFNREHDDGCILGQRLVYERRKRSSICYNGHNYDRPISKEICKCTDHDYECDVGFKHSWEFFCRRDYHTTFNPYAPPRPCPRGTTYNRTQGYRKISGSVCSGGSDFFFGPEKTDCPYNADSAFLMYAERSTVKYLDLTNNNHSTVLEGLRGAVAVAYDMKEAYVYWADMVTHKIMRKSFNKSDEAISIAGIRQVEGLDFDWTTGNLYWIDSVEKVIEVCRKDGRFRKAVHSADLDKPRALALDPAMGEMFWSDWGTPAKIEMSDMDGSNRKVLINSGIVWPNGLAIDISKPRISRILYYTDAFIDIIGSYNMHTRKIKILASRSSPTRIWASVLKHPYSIAVDDINVYWDDWQTGKVYKIHKTFTGNPATLIEKADSSESKKKYEIKVYYRRSQVDSSGCSHVSSCSQLCLPKPKSGHVCECGDGMKIVPSTQKCKCIGGLITLANGTCIRPTGKKCAPHEFSCRNGECIQPEWRCDWFDDCGDSSDEDGCTNKCKKTEYPCPDGRCIPQKYVCNGFKDCEDGVDERHCQNQTSCFDDKFRCSNGICVTKDRRCDDVFDCTDESDEMNCTAVAGKQKSDSKKKTWIWAVPVSIVFAVLLGTLVYFVVKSRRLQRSFYHLVRSDSFDQGVTYHNDGDDDDTPLIQGFSDDDPLVEA